MFERAPLRVRLADGEPPAWLLQRLAHRNGFEDTAEFARCFRMSSDDVRRGFADVRLAELSGLPLEALAGWSPREGETTIELRGETLRAGYDWSSGTPGKPVRACPECLRSDLADRGGPKGSRPFMRAWWCLRDIHHCHVHGTLLVERPGFHPRPFAGAGTRRGGARPFWIDFVDAAPVAVVEVDGAADRYLLGRLGVLPAGDYAVLDGLGLGEASAMISWLGELAVNAGDAMDVRSLSFADAMRVRSAGLALVAEWPSRFLTCLNEVFEKRLVPEAKVGRIYGRFYRRLYDDRAMRDGHAGRDLLKKLLERHALDNVPFRSDDTMFKRPMDQSVRVSPNHAAKIAGVTLTDFGKIAKAMGLAEDGRASDDRWGVRRAVAEQIRAVRAGALTAAQLADMTGVGVPDIERLRRKGLIVPVWPLRKQAPLQIYPAHVAETIREHSLSREPAHAIVPRVG